MQKDLTVNVKPRTKLWLEAKQLQYCPKPDLARFKASNVHK